ncbi:MAG: cytochrome C oxidase subunit IV family protein, partial [Lentisphaeraceae bacterium]|nr:cytochrome C oxidase subunit IV family protein [Lentisphaeraceae bacterium]
MPLSMYFGVGFGLIILTVITVWTAKFMPEQIFHYTKMQITPTIAIIIAMIIASVKAALVCLFFMHLKYDKPLNRLTFISGLFF